MAGDGDGNTNATKESLEANINMFRKAIKGRYNSELQSLGLGDEFTEQRLESSKNPAELIAFLEQKRRELGAEGQDFSKIQSLIRKVSSFGYHFAKIDIRHTAADLSKIDDVVSTLCANEDFVDQIKQEIRDRAEAEKSADEKSKRRRVDVAETVITQDKIRKEIVNKIIFEPEFLDKVNPSDQGKNNQMIVRLLGRFELASRTQNVEMFDKAIIAEFNEPAQIKSVLKILKDTGHVVSGPGASKSSKLMDPQRQRDEKEVTLPLINKVEKGLTALKTMAGLGVPGNIPEPSRGVGLGGGFGRSGSVMTY